LDARESQSTRHLPHVVMHFKDTQLSVPEIAKTLRADALLKGRDSGGDRIRVHAQLNRGPTDEHFGPRPMTATCASACLQSDVAQAIAQRVEVTVSGSNAPACTVRPNLARSIRNYLKVDLPGQDNSRTNIEESIATSMSNQERPTFAPVTWTGKAYSDLAPCLSWRSQTRTPEAILAARQAVQLDRNWWKHVLLADIAQQHGAGRRPK